MRSGEWSGYLTKTSRFAKPWSLASQIEINLEEWQKSWPELLKKIESGGFETLKHDASGEVFSGTIQLGGKEINIIIKHPRRKLLRRYVMDLFRSARAERMWIKAWTLIGRDFPCEWPMLLMQQKILG